MPSSSTETQSRSGAGPKKIQMKKRKTLSIDSNVVTSDDSKETFSFYRHQVAGHYPILWKSGVICKPIQKYELEFYKQVEIKFPALLPFVPRYLGVVSMDYGDLPPTPKSKSTKKEHEQKSPPHPKSQTAEYNRYNQWGLRCHIAKKKVLQNRPKINYIRLEDLTMPFSRPNILDLKIGTRVHGVNDDPLKIQRKKEKSALTTSASLGLRLCGMQVYNTTKNGYTFRDKFFGRDLDQGGFRNSIDEFFSADGFCRVAVIKRLIKQVLELQAVATSQRTFQFFSSSLLFIYEGCRPSDQNRLYGAVKNDQYDRVDLRVIDFAQAACDEEQKGVHEGFILGMKNIVSILRDLCDKYSRLEGKEKEGADSTPEGKTTTGLGTE